MTFSCDKCGKTFTRQFTLDRHLKKKVCEQKEKRIWTCLLCRKTFNSARNLKHHLKSKVCVKAKTHKCTQCHVEFDKKWKLRNHHYNNYVLLRYKCEFCGRGFRTMNGTETHTIKYHYHSVNANDVEIPESFTRNSSSFNGYLNCFSHTPADADNLPRFLNSIRSSLEDLLENVYKVLGAFKFIICLSVTLQKSIANRGVKNIRIRIRNPDIMRSGSSKFKIRIR